MQKADKFLVPSAELIPGKLLRATIRSGDAGEYRPGLGLHPQFAAKPGPKKIGYGAPRGLIGVNLATVHDKDPVRRRCQTTDYIAVRANRRRFRHEQAA